MGALDGIVVGSGVGLPGTYVGATVAVGPPVGVLVGCGVGLPTVYVGDRVGHTEGVLDGETEGWGVGLPAV